MNLTKANILAIDDEDKWPKVKAYLKKKGWDLLTAENATKGLEAILSQDIDLILLDKHLENTDYLTLIQDIKKISSAPVIVMSEVEDQTETILGLEVGADDFINKPFQPRELSARIKANLRLVQKVEADTLERVDDDAKNGNRNGTALIHFGQWYLDQKKMDVLDKDKNPLDFTTGEFQLLEALVMSPNQVLSRDQLFEKTRQEEFDGYDRAVDVQIARIRKKLGTDNGIPDCIKTVRGIGYMLDAKTEKVSKKDLGQNSSPSVSAGFAHT